MLGRPGAMRTSLMGRVLVRCYRRVPARRLLLVAVVRWEGGQFHSRSLREILRRHHGVEVGAFSYGSLLQPGQADAGTTIGRYASIGPNVRRIGAAHPMDRLSLHPFWYNADLGYVTRESDVDRVPCVIGNDVWIGANVVILPGCRRIGDGAVVGAGSIVSKDVADFEIVAGNPARHLRTRLDIEQRQRLLAERPWDLEPPDYHRWLQGDGAL